MFAIRVFLILGLLVGAFRAAGPAAAVTRMHAA